MNERPRLFVELCCGSAAVTLRLFGGSYAEPLTSFMGGKRRDATSIIGVLGLQPGNGADTATIVDAGPWGHAWEAVLDEKQRGEITSTLRGWASEDPRALWDRLAVEHSREWDRWSPERVAGWLWLQARSVSGAPVWYEDGQVVVAEKRARGRHHKPAIQRGVYKGPGRSGTGIHTATIARRIEFAGLVMGDRHGIGPVVQTGGRRGVQSPSTIASRIDNTRLPRTLVMTADVREVEPPDDCEGVVVYFDPPYEGCTPYAVELPRSDVFAVARRWSDAGAVVCVSEAEPLSLGGWHSVRLRDGEWLTLNRDPVWKPAEQIGMFG